MEAPSAGAFVTETLYITTDSLLEQTEVAGGILAVKILFVAHQLLGHFELGLDFSRHINLSLIHI